MLKKGISLVLGGGGSKGPAHLGVIKALVEEGFEIKEIIGTSAGALIGGLYAANPDVEKIEEIFNSLNYRKLFRLLVGKPNRSGLINGEKYRKFIEDCCAVKNIEETKIPFRAVSCDLVSGERYVFEKGPMSTAISASSAIPAIFSPVKYEDKILIDGGAVAPVAIDEARPQKRDKVVAVALFKHIFPKNYQQLRQAGLGRIAYVSMQVVIRNLSKQAVGKADIAVLPDVEDINVLNFVKTKSYVEIGYRAMKEKIGELNKLYEK